jgi:hypothetical protein
MSQQTGIIAGGSPVAILITHMCAHRGAARQWIRGRERRQRSKSFGFIFYITRHRKCSINEHQHAVQQIGVCHRCQETIRTASAVSTIVQGTARHQRRRLRSTYPETGAKILHISVEHAYVQEQSKGNIEGASASASVSAFFLKEGMVTIHGLPCGAGALKKSHTSHYNRQGRG